MAGDPMPIIDRDGILNYAVNHLSRSKCHKRWNGRQIRNAFLTAAALARYEWHDRTENPTANSSPPIFEITARHFDTVARAGADSSFIFSRQKGRVMTNGIRADYLTKPNQLHTPPKHPRDNLHSGYPQPQPPHVPYQDMNREQPTFNSPGYRHNPVPGPGSQMRIMATQTTSTTRRTRTPKEESRGIDLASAGELRSSVWRRTVACLRASSPPPSRPRALVQSYSAPRPTGMSQFD